MHSQQDPNPSPPALLPKTTVSPGEELRANNASSITGESFKAAKPSHELVLGVVAVASGLVLPFLGLVLALATLTKGLRQTRKVLIVLGITALITTALGIYGYYLLYQGNLTTPTKNASSSTKSNSEESNPDAFDAIKLKP